MYDPYGEIIRRYRASIWYSQLTSGHWRWYQSIVWLIALFHKALDSVSIPYLAFLENY
jgi:hypothetical protein